MPRGDFDDVEKVRLTVPANDPSNCLTTIDVLLPSGRRFCRVNVFAHNDGSWGDVDVVLEDGQTAKALALVNGEPILHKTLDGARLVAVDIRQGPVVKSGPKAKQEHAYAAV